MRIWKIAYLLWVIAMIFFYALDHQMTIYIIAAILMFIGTVDLVKYVYFDSKVSK